MALPKVLRPAVFLDRDGTLIQDVDYLSDPGQIRIYRGVPQALKSLKKAGYFLFVVTNQSGVARGYFSEAVVKRVHRVLRAKLKARGAAVDGFYYCPHYPGAPLKAYAKNCSCRKPKPGLVRQVSRDFAVDLKNSYMIGDKLDDLGLAKAARLAGGLLVRTGKGRRAERELKKLKSKVPVVRNLAQAAKVILSKKVKLK
ncbi:MAG: D-glycero-alpha-D-manno-heptose-1,7-bisphosphate 7-phosphatase [bacterium]